jgi:hypothetical protein
VEVEWTILDVKLTVVEDDAVAEEFDSVAKESGLVVVHIFLRRQRLFQHLRCWFDD